MLRSVYGTSSGELDVTVIFGVDADDPDAPLYLIEPGAEVWLLAQCGGFAGDLNAMAKVALSSGYDVLGAFGDDVLFRTQDWDLRLEAELASPAIAYGDDLIHGRNHPSAVFMSRELVAGLGWLALPAVRHQWADDAWKALGQRLGLLRFMEGVVLEHMHPAVAKAGWDAGYEAVLGDNDGAAIRARADHEGFTRWRDTGLIDQDVFNVRQALGWLSWHRTEAEHDCFLMMCYRVAQPVWDDALPPGGWVCGVDGCLAPVESEPCSEHEGRLL